MALIVGLLVLTRAQAQVPQPKGDPWKRPFSMVNLVTDFGATPDDSSDDADAFQDALDYVAESSNLIENFAIFIPPGKYHIKKQLTFDAPKQLTLIGSGPASTLLVPLWNDPTHFLLQINPGLDAGQDGVCRLHLANFGITWLQDDSTSWTKGIQISGVSGNALIDNLRMTNCKSTGLELHPSHVLPAAKYKQVVHGMTIRSSWIAGPTGLNYTEPIIRSVGPLPSTQIRVEDCVIQGAGKVDSSGDTRSYRSIVDIEAGEDWVFAYNRFAGVRRTAITIGDHPTSPGLSRGMRFLGNDFEGIGDQSADRNGNNCLIYIKGRPINSEHPFIGFSTFQDPTSRTIVLENIQDGVIMEMLTRPTNILMEGMCRSNCILPLGQGLHTGDEMNAWLYPTAGGYAITNGLHVASNQALQNNGSLDAGTERPYVSWDIFDSDIGSNGELDLAEANARFTLENQATDSAAVSKLVGKVGGFDTITLTPGLVDAPYLESNQAVITQLNAVNADIQTIKLNRLELDPGHIVNISNVLPQKKLEVFDRNGISLGYIFLY